MLQIRNLTKSFGKNLALDHLSLQVTKGEIVAIMGPSGCGKSTLVRCINRLVEPDQGEIIFNSEAVTMLEDEKLLALRRKIGFVFQHFNLIGRLTTLENILLPLLFYGLTQEEALIKARRYLKQVGLSHKQNVYPAELSGGEQQRIGIARALALEPQIMLWDEPTASLDPILVDEVLKVMEELAGQKITMLVVTHELRFAWKAADRIILMSQGRIVEEGKPQTIFHTPLSEIGKKYQSLWQENYSLRASGA